MPRKFSTSTQTPVKNPLNDLPFVTFEELNQTTETNIVPVKVKEPSVPIIVQTLSQIEETYGQPQKLDVEPKTIPKIRPKKPNKLDSKTEPIVETVESKDEQQTETKVEEKQTKSEKHEISKSTPVTHYTGSITPVIDDDNIDKSDMTIDQLLRLKLEKYNIQNVKIKHLGYNTIDDYIITEYDVIDNQSQLVLLIVNIMQKQVRFQIPAYFKKDLKAKKTTKKSKNKADTTVPLELVAREIQKELKYSWSDWF